MGLMKYKNVILVVLLALLLNHLIVLRQTPSSPDLYKVLGVPPTANATEINAAFESFPKTTLTKEQLFDLRHAHSVLSDARRRQDYDTFQLDVFQEAVQGADKQRDSWFDDIQPDMESHPSLYQHFLSDTQSLDAHNFNNLVLQSDKPWVILLYSKTAVEPHELTRSWSDVAELVSGVASVGRVEIGALPLSVSLATKPLRLPEVVVFQNCLSYDCLRTYRGLKTVQAVTEWVASSVLKLPHVPYPSSLKDVIHGTPHKVKVLIFGSSRAPLFIRHAAKKYQEHAVFAMVDWEEHRAALREYLKEPDLEFPEVVILKDPGLQPVIYQGGLNSVEMERLMEEHKSFVLPQLRSISSEALGCGNSTSGNETWYCVIVAGRTGRQLSEMRGVMRKVLQNLRETENVLAAEALRSRRLSLSWLDGEKQKDFCYFYLHSPTMFEACGPRRYGEVEDIPKVFLIRFHRKPLTREDRERMERARARNVWASLLSDDAENVPSQLVSIYNGSAETGEIVQWISQMVFEGDNQELPGFGGEMPELVPEEKVTFWTETKRIVADGQARAVQNSQWFGKAFSWASHIDIRMAPVIFFLAIFLFSHLFLHRKKMHQDAQSISEAHVD